MDSNKTSDAQEECERDEIKDLNDPRLDELRKSMACAYEDEQARIASRLTHPCPHRYCKIRTEEGNCRYFVCRDIYAYVLICPCCGVRVCQECESEIFKSNMSWDEWKDKIEHLEVPRARVKDTKPQSSAGEELGGCEVTKQQTEGNGSAS